MTTSTELTRERDAARAEADRARPVVDAARRLRAAAREESWVPDAVDGAINDVAAAVDAHDKENE